MSQETPSWNDVSQWPEELPRLAVANGQAAEVHQTTWPEHVDLLVSGLARPAFADPSTGPGAAIAASLPLPTVPFGRPPGVRFLVPALPGLA